MKKRLLMTSYLLLAAAAAAQIPARWDAAASSDVPYDRTVYRGESLALAPLWTDDGVAIDTNGWTFVACWSTNGVQWWSKGMGPDPALTVTGDPFVWSPDMDCGARQYRHFIRAENPGGSVSYRANARFTMLDSPGFTPNALPMPVQVVDFAAVKTINAPWLLPGALGGYATETWAEGLFAKKADIPEIPDLAEADPVALPYAVNASNLAAKAIASALTTNDVRSIADGMGFVADGQDWFGAGKGISVNDGTGPDPISTLFPGQLFMSLVTGGGYYETLFLPYGFHASRVIEEEGWQWKEADILLPRAEGTVTLATEGHVAAAVAAASNLAAKAIASALTTNDVRGIADGMGFVADGQDWFGAGKGISVNDGTGPDPISTLFPGQLFMSLVTGGGYYETLFLPYGFHASRMIEEEGWQWKEADILLPRAEGTVTLATEGHVAAAAAGKVSSATVAAIWTGTQGEYDAIAVPDPQTLYIILEDGP